MSTINDLVGSAIEASRNRMFNAINRELFMESASAPNLGYRAWMDDPRTVNERVTVLTRAYIADDGSVWHLVANANNDTLWSSTSAVYESDIFTVDTIDEINELVEKHALTEEN